MTTIESALVARARGGDALAFRMIFDRNVAAVRRFLRDLLGDGPAADEGAQETFVRAHEGLATLRDGEKVLPWLFGIARNVALEALRARRRQAPDDVQAVMERHIDPLPTPEAAVLLREAEAALGRALASLAHDRRAALVLRIDHDLAYEEIAAVMGWTLAKVKNEIHRARLELRTSLIEYTGGSP
jgi:RNA polymerase sigma-70 factor (ECF subfamily)